MNTEKLQHLISIIGEDRVEKIYEATGGEKISFATLHKQLLIDKIKERINAGHSFKKIARDCHISRMTVYRIFHGYLKKKSRK